MRVRVSRVEGEGRGSRVRVRVRVKVRFEGECVECFETLYVHFDFHDPLSDHFWIVWSRWSCRNTVETRFARNRTLS